jgi:DNA-3-methyladenine glycosylase
MQYKKLPKEFYIRKCLPVAKELIGKILVRRKGRKLYSGIIVETEAYTGSSDAASHAYRGMTERNKYMFSEGGAAYVYFTYGNHYCMNVVVEKEDISHAVLIRALEPVDGIEYMKKNRRTDNIYNLASGPGKLTEAMEISLEQNGEDLTGDELFIAEPAEKRKFKIVKSKRIGITKNADKLYRFYAADNPFVSRINVNSILKKQK